MNPNQEKSTLFWCTLLHGIIFEKIPQQQHHSHLIKVSQQACLFPNGQLKNPSLSTLKRKLKLFNPGGIQALKRKARNDCGQSRKWSSQLIQAAVNLKEDLPSRSADTINTFLQEQHQVTIPSSTLYRHLKQQGATRFKLDVSTKKVRCRWTRDESNDLWVGDFEYGQYVYHQEQVLLTYLSLFIDCHSRYVVEGRYYVKQSLDVLIDTLLRAFSKHGIPNGLFLDNGKVYRSDVLKSACYDLHIELIHRTVRDPAPGGLVERLFLSSQRQFETEVRAGDILTLDKLNQSFSAWLEVIYHQRIHSELKATPAEVYQGAIKRSVDMAAVARFFMKKVKRTVHKTFSDIAVGNRFYSVDRRYRGDKLQLHYDPFSAMTEVFLHDLQGKYLCKVQRYQREKTEQAPTKIQEKPKHSYLDLINQKHQAKIKSAATATDFTQLNQRWSYAAFLKQLAQLLGKSGVSTFDQQLNTLKQTYDRFENLNHAMLVCAFEKAETKNIYHIILQMQTTTNTKNKL